ncbi:MAG: thioesterase [Flavobacteriales bacterium]|nr:MAG: thioesterase [Flavobacteriales bacterium]
MYTSTTKVRVRYSETDMMGYCYYGNYATYFEVARVEAIRQLGFSYRQMEDDGIALPVLEFAIKYFKPAFYDDELMIETTITEVPKARIHFTYKTFNTEGVLLNEAKTSLVFINKKTMKPCSAPADFIKTLEKHFEL